jgi:penicillin-binding protein 1A
MKVATRDDKPDWLTPPSGVTSATVCRLSGKLATDACRNTYVENSDGSLSQRTMAYTEYFARGTAPTEFCDLHESPGILTRITGAFGIETKPAPSPQVEAVGVQVAPPAPVHPTAAPAPSTVEPVPPPAPVKRRGFWGRVFGIGRGEPQKSENPKKPRD